MKKSMKFAAALAGAAVVVVGGTAFTNSNTMPTDAWAGTGSTSVTGIAATDAHYFYATGTTNLNKVTWDVTQAVPNAKYTITSVLTKTEGGGTQDATSCTAAPGDPAGSVITCNYAAIDVKTLSNISLTVVPVDATTP